MPSNVKLLAGASGGEPTDANFKNVTLLLHGDGSNGAQNNTFIDSSTNNFTITRNGNTTQGSFSPYGSNWSNYFDGSGDYLTASSNAAFGVGTGDFTIEAWIFPTGAWTSGGFNCLLQIDGTGIYFGQNNAGFGLRQSGTSNIISYGTSPTLNTWTHVAIVRSGTTVTMYYNGTSVATATSSANFSSGGAWVGADAGPSSYYAGYISNLRLVKGTAVYTSNFTPASSPLTAITNTSLLTCAYNRFRDGSTNNFTITRNGDVKVTNFAPFAPSSAYSTTTNGGSAYFDGSGDYLSVARNTAFIPTTGDFTIEAWVYPTTSGTTRFIMGLLEQGTAGDWSIFLHTNDTLGFFAGGADSFGGTVTPYQWNHVAISRSGSTIYKCVNGTATTATFTNSLDSSTGYNLTIGADNAGDEILFYGWMTDARVVKGTAIYTSTTYTVPTAPLTAVTNTGFLAKFQNAAIFDNSMKNDLETVGNAQISTSVKKFGTGSMYFDGAGDYLDIVTNQVFAFGTGDFTIEGWFYTNTTSGDRNLVDFRPSGTNGAYPNIFIAGGGYLSYNANGSVPITGGTVINTGTWYHFALARSGTSTKLFLNGTQQGSTYSDSTNYIVGDNRPRIATGGYGSGVANFDGYLDDIRITKGVARYTANFTPPTAPFPNK